MSAWTYRSSNGNADPKIVSPRPRIPSWKGPGADSEEKHEPVSDIDTVAVDSLKALDPQWPIREEKHEPVSDIDTVAVDSLKALDPQWPIREADIARLPQHGPFNSELAGPTFCFVTSFRPATNGGARAWLPLAAAHTPTNPWRTGQNSRPAGHLRKSAASA